jgi:hypothetical protein
MCKYKDKLKSLLEGMQAQKIDEMIEEVDTEGFTLFGKVYSTVVLSYYQLKNSINYLENSSSIEQSKVNAVWDEVHEHDYELNKRKNKAN